MFIKTESHLCWGPGGRILTTDLLMAYNCVREDKSSDCSGGQGGRRGYQWWVLSHQRSKLCSKGLSQHTCNLWFNHIFTLLFAYPYVTLVLTGYNSQMQRSVSCSKPLFPSSFFSDQNKWFWSLEKKKQTSNSRWVRLFIGLVTVCHTVPMILTNSSSECIL